MGFLIIINFIETDGLNKFIFVLYIIVLQCAGSSEMVRWGRVRDYKEYKLKQYKIKTYKSNNLDFTEIEFNSLVNVGSWFL